MGLWAGRRRDTKTAGQNVDAFDFCFLFEMKATPFASRGRMGQVLMLALGRISAEGRAEIVPCWFKSRVEMDRAVDPCARPSRSADHAPAKETAAINPR